MGVKSDYVEIIQGIQDCVAINHGAKKIKIKVKFGKQSLSEKDLIVKMVSSYLIKEYCDSFEDFNLLKDFFTATFEIKTSNENISFKNEL